MVVHSIGNLMQVLNFVFVQDGSPHGTLPQDGGWSTSTDHGFRPIIASIHHISLFVATSVAVAFFASRGILFGELAGIDFLKWDVLIHRLLNLFS